MSAVSALTNARARQGSIAADLGARLLLAPDLIERARAYVALFVVARGYQMEIGPLLVRRRRTDRGRLNARDAIASFRVFAMARREHVLMLWHALLAELSGRSAEGSFAHLSMLLDGVRDAVGLHNFHWYSMAPHRHRRAFQRQLGEHVAAFERVAARRPYEGVPADEWRQSERIAHDFDRLITRSIRAMRARVPSALVAPARRNRSRRVRRAVRRAVLAGAGPPADEPPSADDPSLGTARGPPNVSFHGPFGCAVAPACLRAGVSRWSI